MTLQLCDHGRAQLNTGRLVASSLKTSTSREYQCAHGRIISAFRTSANYLTHGEPPNPTLDHGISSDDGLMDPSRGALSLDISNPKKRPGAPVLSSFVFLDTTRRPRPQQSLLLGESPSVPRSSKLGCSSLWKEQVARRRPFYGLPNFSPKKSPGFQVGRSVSEAT